MTSTAVELAILAGYDQDPMYFDAQDGDFHNHTIDEAAEYFGFSDDLTRELHEWDEELQGTFNLAVPQDSGFPSPQHRHAWIEKGKELAARIKRESPVVTSVDYQADGYFQDGTCVF
ncbi:MULTISPECIES: hypothetical protein [Actinoalloteichus]|uniref:Uncharacterized protein n=1 Tax=Actinoalloteichus fjordicus TaxID=1612552 RepID=A0AAC9LCX1_9PSEU|nr:MULTISPECIES: hypothetical protein [Actinoalloteichus]APU14080.1 hypothetical protein UA74_10085 [Actinoalloteichus fjordicus]APU20027.1 hypothetical protein UA75_10060 [Actinoalloteichus sp. GBA129-24]